MPWLTVLIEVPLFLVLAWLFARGRPVRYSLPVIAGSLLMAVAASGWAFQVADPSHGPIWPQVLAALAGYGVFLLAMLLGWWLPRLAERRG